MILRVTAPHGVGGTLAAPPSKSMAHRAVLCAALAEGRSVIHNLALSRDIRATLDAAGQLSATVEIQNGCAAITGLGRFLPLSGPVDCGESGSTLRFLIPLFSLSGQEVTFTGHGRLLERPQGVYQQIFREQGLRFEASAASLTIQGALRGGEYHAAGNVSSQFVSGLLFALPLAGADSVLHLAPPVESRSYIEMTRAVQQAFGVHSAWLDPYTLAIPGNQRYAPCDYTVEGDYSQAAFIAVLGALCGDVTLCGLALPTLQGDAVILDILRRCGAQFAQDGRGALHFAKSSLQGVEIDLADCPDLGPVLMVLGLFCRGQTVLRNAGRLRIKESDRIAAMEQELRRCGGRIRSNADTVWIDGCAAGLHLPEQPLQAHNDHRVVMSLAVLALAAGLPLAIEGAEAVQKSWPDFFAAVKALGVEGKQIG